MMMALAATYAGTERAVAQDKHTKAQQIAQSSYPAAVEEAKLNAPPTGYASIYYLRPKSIVGKAVCFWLEVDKRTWGGLANGQYSWDPLSPGEHSFQRTIKGGVSLNAEPGKTYYAVISAGGLGGGGVKFVSPEEGEKIKGKLSLNPDRWLLRQYLANWPSVRLGMTLPEVEQLITISEGRVFYDVSVHPEKIPGIPGLLALVSEDEFEFRSMLGYSLNFVSGVLTEKHERVVKEEDSHGCPGPALQP